MNCEKNNTSNIPVLLDKLRAVCTWVNHVVSISGYRLLSKNSDGKSSEKLMCGLFIYLIIHYSSCM